MKNLCEHKTTLGCSWVDGVEVGLCPDCRRVIIIINGKLASKKLALKWMAKYPQEVKNFDLREIYNV